MSQYAEWPVEGGGGGVTSVGPFGESPNESGATISGQTLTLEPASEEYPGGVSILDQVLGAGEKTFVDTMNIGPVSGDPIRIGPLALPPSNNPQNGIKLPETSGDLPLCGLVASEKILKLLLNESADGQRNESWPGIQFMLDARNNYGLFHIYAQKAGSNSEYEPFAISEDMNIRLNSDGEGGTVVGGASPEFIAKLTVDGSAAVRSGSYKLILREDGSGDPGLFVNNGDWDTSNFGRFGYAAGSDQIVVESINATGGVRVNGGVFSNDDSTFTFGNHNLYTESVSFNNDAVVINSSGDLLVGPSTIYGNGTSNFAGTLTVAETYITLNTDGSASFANGAMSIQSDGWINIGSADMNISGFTLSSAYWNSSTPQSLEEAIERIANAVSQGGTYPIP